MPQDDVVFPDLPAQKNQPLQIVSHGPAGDREVTIITGAPTATCLPTPDLGVIVHEPDVGDRTSVLWYIDRTATSAPADFDTVYGPSVDRKVLAKSTLLNQLSTVADGKRHVLEVFVTDGDFIQGATITASHPPYSHLPDGGPVADTAFLDSYVWLVQVERCQ